MTIDEFHSIVRILANQTWVRYYLGSYPKKMVIEVCSLDQSDLGQLRKDLAKRGFQEMPPISGRDDRLVRFSVDRVDDEPAQ